MKELSAAKHLLCLCALVVVLLVPVSAFSTTHADFSKRGNASGLSESEYLKLLENEDIYKRVYAIYNIGHKKIPARDKLMALAAHDNPWVRRAAVFSLGLNPDDTLMPLLEKTLADEDYGVRRAAVIALGNAKSGKAGPLLARALGDSDYGVRELAVIAIVMNGIKGYVPQLIELLEDGSIRIRRTAARALGALGDKTAVKPLRQLMADIENKKVRPRDESVIRTKLKKKGSYPYGFIHFPLIMDRFSEDSGIELRVNDEVLYGLYINAQNPDNLDSVKLKFYHTPTSEALKKIANSAGAYYYIESGTLNIAAKSYIYFDTNLEFEAAASLWMLGDKSYEETIRAYRNLPLYKDRVKHMLK